MFIFGSGVWSGLGGKENSSQCIQCTSGVYQSQFPPKDRGLGLVSEILDVKYAN